MNSLKVILSALVLSVSLTTFAQETTPSTNSAKSTNKNTEKEPEKQLTKQEKKEKRLKNIHFINKNIMIRPAYSLQSNNLRITDRLGQGTPMNYRPNVWGSAGGQLKYGGLSFSYMFKLPVQDEGLGETDYRTIGMNIQTRYVGLEFDFSNYNGFYMADSKDTPFLPITDGADRTLVPSLDYYTIGFKTTFAFKKDFSINAGFSQTERMKKSAGSFMMSIGDRFTRINADTSFIAYDQQEFHNKFSEPSYKGLSFNSTYLALGMGYSFVKGYFSFTPIVLIGTGPQLQWYKDRQRERLPNWHLRLPLYLSYKNAVSYNHDNFFMRLIWSAELNESSMKPKGTGYVYSEEAEDMILVDYKNDPDYTRLSMFHLNLEASLGVRFMEKPTKEEKKAKKKAKKEAKRNG